MSAITKGDYVLATKYQDGDPKDHWAIGFYNGYEVHCSTLRHDIIDGEGKSFRSNGFRSVKKITPSQGKWLLDHKTDIEASGRSVWYWLRKGPEVLVCTFDNPASMMRECWQDEHLIYACQWYLVIGKPQLPARCFFFGANIGPWKDGQVHGDLEAIPASIRQLATPMQSASPA